LRFIEASTKGQESQNGRDWRRQARPRQLHRGSEFGFPRLNFGKGTPKSRVRRLGARWDWQPRPPGVAQSAFAAIHYEELMHLIRQSVKFNPYHSYA
jgi:hypothetical protein